MREFTRVMIEAHACIKGGRTKPNRAAFGACFQHFPQTHMLASIRALPKWLLEREVLAAAFDIKRAHRRVSIRAIGNDAADDFDAGSEGNRVRRKPVGRSHEGHQLFTRSYDAD